MYSLPLLAYSAGQCPVCALMESLLSLLERVRSEFPRLEELILEAILELEPIPAVSAAMLGLEQLTNGAGNVWGEALRRSQLEGAKTDVEVRKQLVKKLGEPTVAAAVAAAVGRAPGDAAFRERELARIQMVASASVYESGVERLTLPEPAGAFADILSARTTIRQR